MFPFLVTFLNLARSINIVIMTPCKSNECMAGLGLRSVCASDCDLVCVSFQIQILTRPPQKEGQDICSLCELVVSFVKPFVDSNSTEVYIYMCILATLNLRTRDTLGPVVLSLVERLSLSRR